MTIVLNGEEQERLNTIDRHQYEAVKVGVILFLVESSHSCLPLCAHQQSWDGGESKTKIPKYLRKSWLKALLLGQRRRCQTCMLGVEQVTCIHIKSWNLGCSTSRGEV